MPSLPIQTPLQTMDSLSSFLDKIIHPTRDSSVEKDHDPSRPFTPPPSEPSKAEEEDDDGGPPFPMDPALA